MATQRFTKEQRQVIVREFAVRHNGTFNPKLFLEEVRKVGESHPAHGWFEWDADRAVYEHHLWQAREFAQGLKVTFQVEQVGRKTTMKLVTTQMPMVLSPRDTRRDGGGYVLVDPQSADHMAEHCRQAAVALRTWMNRYNSALLHVSYPSGKMEDVAQLLENVQAAQVAAE